MAVYFLCIEIKGFRLITELLKIFKFRFHVFICVTLGLRDSSHNMNMEVEGRL